MASSRPALVETPKTEPVVPYSRQMIDDKDLLAVAEVLRSPWLTTGPKVDEFERLFAHKVGAREAVALSSGTAALHAAMAALDIGPGDEVIVPAMTFAATANCVVYQGGTPVFADVDTDTLLIDPADVKARLSSRTRAIIAVDYAGQPCDYARLGELAIRSGISLVSDACHSLGASLNGAPVGSLTVLNAFSFHPVKAITTGEGGIVTTCDLELADRMRRFRNHGIDSDHRQRALNGSWFYEMVELGCNYRMSDLQAALGISQLRKLDNWVDSRQRIAQLYDEAFLDCPEIQPLHVRPSLVHAYHLYVVRLERGRDEVYRALRSHGIGANVHYIPVHLHPFYRKRFQTADGLCPRAEAAYGQILSLPVYPAMSEEQVLWVASTVSEAARGVK
jgi:perosamine synthetase